MQIITPFITGTTGVPLEYIAQSDVGTQDVRKGKKFIYPSSGKLATGTGDMVKTASGVITCSMNPETFTIDTGFSKVLTFVGYVYGAANSYGARYTLLLYTPIITLHTVVSDGMPYANSQTSKNFYVNGGVVTINSLYCDYSWHDMREIPWYATGY